METKVLIDALPYIDKSAIQKIGKSTIEELINSEMDKVDKSKIAAEINAKYPISNRKHIRNDKINKTIGTLKDSLEVPLMNKYYNEEEWEKLFKELNYTIESKQIDNFNLDLINAYASSAWDRFINKSMNHLTQLKHERDTLRNDILLLNKKRKYDQTLYQNELNAIDKKIDSTLGQITLIEGELINK